jgi:hypothetical protein
MAGWVWLTGYRQAVTPSCIHLMVRLGLEELLPRWLPTWLQAGGLSSP